MATEYESVIGLEIHAQLLTETKIFCGCSTRFGAPPNTQVCPVCLGLPGALPVLNARAVDLAVRAACAVGCRIHRTSVFARKNYFYPDLPKGYQISQYDRPLATDGRLDADIAGPPYPVGIVRVHLEEDAGKSLHEGFTDSDRRTYVDFNRSGVPLIEIVSRPDLRSAADAADFFRRLRELLVAIGVTDGNMEHGSLRCDANVSVRPAGEAAFGTKTEIKNLNSFRFLQKALDYEIRRQIVALRAGDRILHETRLWDVVAGRTVLMRSKEEAHDYRYFPEPDLPPLELSGKRVDGVCASLPELPDQRRRRLVREHGLSEADAVLFTQTYPGMDQYFLEAAAVAGNPRSAANWLKGEVVRKMNETGTDEMRSFAERVPAEQLGRLIQLAEKGVINGPTAKDVFEKMYATLRPAEDIVNTEGLAQIDDAAALLRIVRNVIERHPGPLAEYRRGRAAVFGFFVGQVIKDSGGRANPRLVNELVRRELDRTA
jgi:aspartyl-tRNA(Asn)/glutamyl-tRNA(Gln) amidotransferase subunit B